MTKTEALQILRDHEERLRAVAEHCASDLRVGMHKHVAELRQAIEWVEEHSDAAELGRAGNG